MEYNIYIDLNNGDGYVLVQPDSIEPFKFSRDTTNRLEKMKQFFYRISWGKVQFSNRPFLFKDSVSIYDSMYNTINSLEFDKEIRIKCIFNGKEIIGYFGKNDCEFDDDRKILSVTPEIVDDYTVLFENMSNEIDLNSTIFNYKTIIADFVISNLKQIQDWPVDDVKLYELIIDYIDSNGITHYKQGKIIPNTFPRNRVKESDYSGNGGLLAYFDGQGPKTTLFADTYWGFATTCAVWSDNHATYDDIATNTLADRVNILGQTPSSDSLSSNYGPNLDFHYGDYELSKFRVYEGNRTGGLSGSRWRNLYCQTWFTRDEIIKIDEVDATSAWGFKSPVGDGWNMRIATTLSGKNAHFWTRKPYNGAFSTNWVLGDDVINENQFNYTFTWNKYKECTLSYSLEDSSLEIDNAIDFREFFETILHKSHTALSTMLFKSIFFFNDMEDEINVRHGMNYVSGEPNPLNKLSMFFSKDLIPKTESSSKIVLPKASISKILDDINKLFSSSLCWFIDQYGNFRIEHIEYIDIVKKTIDISGSSLLDFTNKYSYDKSGSFEDIAVTQINSGYQDFVDNVLKFPHIVSNNRNNDLSPSISTSFFSTDVKYAIENPGSLSDGYILVALDANNTIINKQCQVSGKVEYNGELAISTLLINYGKYEGVWEYGFINDSKFDFLTIQRNKVYDEITIKKIILSYFYSTKVGIGEIISGEFNVYSNSTKIKLAYRFLSEKEIDLFYLIANNFNIFDIDNQTTTQDQDLLSISISTINRTVLNVNVTYNISFGSTTSSPTILETGICISTFVNPDRNNSKVIPDISVALGNHTVTLVGANPMFKYYAVAYVITDNGTYYSDQKGVNSNIII